MGLDKTQAAEKTAQLYERLAGRRPSIDQLDNAYAGNQKLNFASKEWSTFHQNQYTNFSDNWVAVVADALAERITVTGVSLGSSDEDKAAADALWQWWLRNDLEMQSSQGFLASIVSKRSMAIVSRNPDNENVPVVTWEDPSQVYVEFSADGARRKLSALKVWVDDDTEYAVLYTPTHAWKWKRVFVGLDVTDGYTSNGIFVGDSLRSTSWGGGEWEQWIPDSDSVWPFPHGMGEVPVVEFPNRPKLKRGPISDVEGALSMQDAINLFWAYLFGAADYASLPARVVMGQASPKIPILDDDGQVVGEQDIPLSDLQKGRIMWLTGTNAKIGEWSRADLEAFTKVIEVAVGHLGAQSRTPAHYFVANKGLSNINGETLIATETPLVKKSEEFMLYAQKPLRELWGLIATVLLGLGAKALVATAQTQFANPAIRSDAQLADALAKDRTAGYPFEYLLEKYGESPDNIARIMEMRRQEMFDPQFQELADRVSEDVGF